MSKQTATESKTPVTATIFEPALWGKDFLEKSTQSFTKAGVILLIGLPLILIGTRVCKRLFTHRLGHQGGALLARVLSYVGYIILTITILQQFGFDLGAVLGAAGIAGVAVGFASQTSLSNLISGLFIVGERPFEKGDVIEVDSLSGTVEEIGLLALTLRTFDNRSVRVPNETLVKTKVVTVTRYPIRRVDLQIGVSYNESIARVMDVLRAVAEAHPAVLDEPATLVTFTGFGESSLNFMIGAWGTKEDFLTIKNELPRWIKEAFDREGIEIPYPHRVLKIVKED